MQRENRRHLIRRSPAQFPPRPRCCPFIVLVNPDCPGCQPDDFKMITGLIQNLVTRMKHWCFGSVLHRFYKNSTDVAGKRSANSSVRACSKFICQWAIFLQLFKQIKSEIHLLLPSLWRTAGGSRGWGGYIYSWILWKLFTLNKTKQALLICRSPAIWFELFLILCELLESCSHHPSDLY